MYGPSTSSLASRARQHGDESSAVHHRDAIGEREHLGELGRDEQDRLARVARRAQLRVNELDRADVDAARRLRGEQHLKSRAHLARDHDLLLVAAGERARRQQRIGRADVERRDLLRARSSAMRVPIERARRCVKRCCWPRIRLSATE